MPALTLRSSVDVDTVETYDSIDAIRAEFVKRLRQNSALLSCLGGDIEKIARRYRKSVVQPTDYPIVTYFDFGGNPDDIVPLMDITYQVDIWAEDTNLIMGHILNTLNLKPFGVIGDGAANVTFIKCTDWRDDPVNDGDVERKMLTFRVLAYSLK